MGMNEAVRSFFNRYTDFQGRSRRAEYWWIVLAFIIFFGILGTLIFTIGGGMDSSGSPDLNPIGWLLAAVFAISYLGVIVPNIALMVRRFHDLDQTGWLVLVFVLLGLIPLVGFLASIGQIIWFAMPGTQGPNKYGADPKEGGHNVDVFS